MNIIEKTIAYFSPQTALNRQIARTRLSLCQHITNSGYSEGGASRIKKSVAGWNHESISAQEDIDYNLSTLRQRSRNLFMTAPIATSAIKTSRTNVIGAGLRLKCCIDYAYLGISREQAEEWKLNTEREFAIWANSKWCDALRVNNFYDMQQLAHSSWLMNGDAFAVIKHKEAKPWQPYGLRLHMIEADRVSTPNTAVSSSFRPIGGRNTSGKAPNGNLIFNGVEVDKDGGVVAYWICNQYPNSKTGKRKEWVRVEAFGKETGQPNILQLMETERCEQYRGVPYLAPVIETLKQISRYTDAELMAAVVTAFFTAFIKQDGPKGEMPFGESIPAEQQVDTADEHSYELGAGTVNVLGVNEDVVFADPKRPASGFDPFVKAMCKQIGAALEIPYELLTKSFTASYSASRAALLEAWKAFRMKRAGFAIDFCQPVYELWLAEAIAKGRVKAPGFFNDVAIRQAWCQAEWHGPSPGQIDPVKEVKAAIERVENGFSTRERETIELTGGDFDKNVQQLARENDLLSKTRGPKEKGEEGSNEDQE